MGLGEVNAIQINSVICLVQYVVVLRKLTKQAKPLVSPDFQVPFFPPHHMCLLSFFVCEYSLQPFKTLEE